MRLNFYFVTICILAAALGYAQANNVTLVKSTDGYTFVDISLKDISRIHCESEIESTVYSKEKQIEIKTSGRDAFVKILPKMDNLKNKLLYEDIPRELFVSCGGEVFSLVLVPKDIPSQTVILRNTISDIKKAGNYEIADSYEKTIMKLIQSAYLEVPPDGYTVRHINASSKNFKEIDLIEMYEYSGLRYAVTTYYITAKQDIELKEKNFVYLMGNDVAAVAILKPTLKQGESTRMFIVRRKK